MSEQADTARIVADCERYWRETGVPRPVVAEMRMELEQHLREAAAEGRRPQEVTGPDLAAFAEAWASEQRALPTRGAPSWDEVTTGVVGRRRRSRWDATGLGLLTVVVVAAALVLGGGGDPADNETWRWLWTGFALVMGIGEIFTAGFFLLPFAIGAGAAAALAWLNVDVLAQWLVFFAVSGGSLAYLQSYIRRQDEDEPQPIGANRYQNATALVLETVDPAGGTGMVRVESERWRATTSGEVIEAGRQVRVTGVSGTRLVVTAIDE
ncbi:MAG: NfeD family protein [Acidimicrobiia bacterium]